VTYGVGFGDVSPPISPGRIADQANSLNGLSIAFDNLPSPVNFAGLTPGFVGLYQFNFVVPNAPAGDSQVIFTIGQQRVKQTLFLTIGPS
jgi:uncharacterized protein (TIGR03437 family)